ncbi:hypothetical protein HMPREF9997_00856 [Corynebacterium durum F0235]|uniref:Uncharacterized protein n=1 Tax=Corynebacterium durum F0235 TaxID=1035195 RepID=L1MIY9_9CORY|nr:hypothetical protein HMPREF9997_00856 [Corynebacterium durum F0235]
MGVIQRLSRPQSGGQQEKLGDDRRPDPKPMPSMQSKPAKNKSIYAYNFLNNCTLRAGIQCRGVCKAQTQSTKGNPGSTITWSRGAGALGR